MAELTVAPVLSTPAENLFDQVETFSDDLKTPRKTDNELRDLYEIVRTAQEIRKDQRRCVALQFPDSMLGDAPRIVGLLKAELSAQRTTVAATAAAKELPNTEEATEEKIYILADTSYSACCVDEVAAEHADADVVVHYGRSCLSPTSRLPVIYVFTKHTLDEDLVVDSFGLQFPDKESAKVILMADVTYQDHVPTVFSQLQKRGYSNVLSTAVVHNPQGSIPNRQIVDSTGQNVAELTLELSSYAIFHISNPPTSLLLALAARVGSFFIYPTPSAGSEPASTASTTSVSLLAPSTMGMLGRRYAKVIKMSTAGVIGILVNTLSVSNYLSAVSNIRKRIAEAGKKSYLVVVGKLNPVKLANFAEIEGWVVVGCWESSLVEDDAGFYQPVVTPFELEMALKSDDERIWGLSWWGGLEGFSAQETQEGEETNGKENGKANGQAAGGSLERDGEEDDEDEDEESDVPQFDLRTGRLITTSRPMRKIKQLKQKSTNGTSKTNGDTNTTTKPPLDSLTLRPKAELATINGVVSPGAQYLRSQRTWQGLGTDFNNNNNDEDEEEPSTLIEEGRSGIARGYAVGEEAQRT